MLNPARMLNSLRGAKDTSGLRVSQEPARAVNAGANGDSPRPQGDDALRPGGAWPEPVSDRGEHNFDRQSANLTRRDPSPSPAQRRTPPLVRYTATRRAPRTTFGERPRPCSSSTARRAAARCGRHVRRRRWRSSRSILRPRESRRRAVARDPRRARRPGTTPARTTAWNTRTRTWSARLTSTARCSWAPGARGAGLSQHRRIHPRNRGRRRFVVEARVQGALARRVVVWKRGTRPRLAASTVADVERRRAESRRL